VARLTAAAVALLSALCLAAGTAAAEEETPPFVTPAPIGVDGAWSYFSDPRAVQVTVPRKLLWTGWVTSNGSIAAGTYDPATQRVQTMVLHDRLQNNDHANPSVLALPDGRITYFWSAHNGLFMYYRTTTVAGDVHSFGPLRTLPVRLSGDRLYTYSNPMLLPAEGNRLYLFWRSQYTHQVFSTSDDLGAHWSPARVLLEEPGQRPYVKYAANSDTIGIAFTRSHPDENRTGIYYMSYWRGAFFRADGTAIGGVDDLPFAPSQTELVVDPAVLGGSAWIMDVALDAAGNPVIVYATTGAGHRYHYVRWDGAQWHDTLLTDAGPAITTNSREPSYSGGIALDHSDPSTVLLSRKVGDHNVVERWHTSDGGATFTSAPVEQDLRIDNLRPVVPRGLTADDSVRGVWMAGSYRYFTEFSTAIAGPPALPITASSSGLRLAPGPARVITGTVRPVTARLFALSSGQPAAHAEVTLFERRLGGLVWSRVSSARTDATGLVSFRFRVTDHVELMISWPGDERWLPVQSATLRIGADAPR
jgi:hypothetical protein